MVVEKLKEREDKRDEERDKVHNPDLEQRVKELERVVKELIEYKIDKEVELRWDDWPYWFETHDYKFTV